MTYNTQHMLQKAATARNNAYAPYSKFLVGACILTEDGQLFTGCNVENAAYGLGICAEANAISNMVLQGQHKIKEILVVQVGDNPYPPCGGCRQRIFEFADEHTLIHIANTEKVLKTLTIHELLPEPFGPHNLK